MVCGGGERGPWSSSPLVRWVSLRLLGSLSALRPVDLLWVAVGRIIGGFRVRLPDAGEVGARSPARPIPSSPSSSRRHSRPPQRGSRQVTASQGREGLRARLRNPPPVRGNRGPWTLRELVGPPMAQVNRNLTLIFEFGLNHRCLNEACMNNA
jgi:hypothetical protein